MADVPAERWLQRLDEFSRSVDLFARTSAIRSGRPLSEAEEGGLVHFFELSVELGWKTMAAYLRANGTSLPNVSPLIVIREAMRAKIILDGDIWSDAVERRNQMSHTYDPDAFRALIDDAANRFLPVLERLRYDLTMMANE